MGLTGYMAAAMGVMLLAFGVYFKISQNEIAQLNQEMGIAKVEAASAKANLEFVKTQVAQQAESLSALAIEQQAIRKESLKVADIFSKHDLALLASKKPGLIQNRINAGTADVFAELERIE